MADRKAVNKYYPPEWDPSKGSINSHRKSHPLRHRARKIDQGILVVRFEMPFNIWCLKCNNHIAMGVRYNAEKSKTGNYYSTPIYKFRMKCHLCDNYFEIQTEPSKLDYAILSGAKRQARATQEEIERQGSDNLRASGPHDDESVYETLDEASRRVTDAMFRLEKKIEDKLKVDAQMPALEEIKQSTSKYKESFVANSLVRAQFRNERHKIKERKERERRIRKRVSSRIPLDRSEAMKKEAILSSAIISKPQIKGEICDTTKPNKLKSSLKTVMIKKEY